MAVRQPASKAKIPPVPWIDNLYTPPLSPPPSPPLLVLLHLCLFSKFKVNFAQIEHKFNKLPHL